MLRAVIFVVAFIYLLSLPFHWPAWGDSAHYVYASQSLLLGNGWQVDPAFPYWGTTVYAEWSPLQSLTLAAIQFIGFDAQTSVRLLHATCYAAVVLIVWQTCPKWLVLPLFTPVFTISYQSAMSEPLFILLVAVFLVLLPRKPLPLAALSIVATLAWLQRYSGVFLVVFGVVYILLRPDEKVIESEVVK